MRSCEVGERNPYTVFLINGTRREAVARKLIDYLTSAEVELAFVCSKSRQVPSVQSQTISSPTKPEPCVRG